MHHADATKNSCKIISDLLNKQKHGLPKKWALLSFMYAMIDAIEHRKLQFRQQLANFRIEQLEQAEEVLQSLWRQLSSIFITEPANSSRSLYKHQQLENKVQKLQKTNQQQRQVCQQLTQEIVDNRKLVISLKQQLYEKQRKRYCIDELSQQIEDECTDQTFRTIFNGEQEIGLKRYLCGSQCPIQHHKPSNGLPINYQAFTSYSHTNSKINSKNQRFYTEYQPNNPNKRSIRSRRSTMMDFSDQFNSSIKQWKQSKSDLKKDPQIHTKMNKQEIAGKIPHKYSTCFKLLKNQKYNSKFKRKKSVEQIQSVGSAKKKFRQRLSIDLSDYIKNQVRQCLPDHLNEALQQNKTQKFKKNNGSIK